MKKFFIIILIFLLFKVEAQKIIVPSILNDLVEQSFQKYPKIAELKQMVLFSEVKVELGKAGYLPVISGDISYRRLYPTPVENLPIGNDQHIPIQFFPANNFNTSLNINQPLIDFKTEANVGKVQSELQSSNDNMEKYKLQMGYQIAQIYFSIIFLNKSLVVEQQQLNLINANLGIINSKMQNGDALKYDFISTQVSYTNAENYYIDLQNQLDKQYTMLTMLTGNKNIIINDTLIDYKVFDLFSDSIVLHASDENFDVKIAKDRMNTTAWDIIAADRNKLPSLNLQAGAGYKNGFIPNIGDLLFNYSVGIGLTIPIVSGSRPRIQKKMSQINLDASRLDLETEKLIFEKDVSNALDDIRKNDKKMAGSDIQITQAQLALDLATERYKQGTITNFELLTAQTNYQNACLNKLQFGYNLILSKMELNRLVGKKWW